MNPSAALICATLLLTAAAAPGDVVLLAPTQDNTLYEDPLGTLSNGAGQYLFAGMAANGQIRRALVQFDLNSIPAGSQVTGVSLTLHMSRSIASPLPMTLHRVTTPWGEAGSDALNEEGNGTPAQPGDATWLHSVSPAAFWRAPGGDFATAASAERVVGAEGFYTFGPSGGLAADVQAWLSNPSTNHGWILRGLEEFGVTSAKRFDSREHLTPEFRPVLRVEYTAIPSPAGLALLACGGAFLRRRR
jgi:hypothetical protein